IEYYNDIYGGTTGVVSTVKDMIKWYNFLIKEDFFTKHIPVDAEFSCGWYNNEEDYAFICDYNEIRTEVEVGNDGELNISVMNRQPIPDGHAIVMYYPIECDDGYFKLEIWHMLPNSEIKVNSIKIFDEYANELYSAEVPESGYFISLRNDGEKRHAEEFAENGTYYYEINLAEILKNEFKPLKKYIVEVKLDGTKYSAYTHARLGMVYKRKNEWISVPCDISYNYDCAYDVFISLLANTMNFLNDKFYEFVDAPQNEE
ncbi:MAG: hypothetical protein K2G04_00645, partial [Oscillospiraceae bacterium]|nr:hypothetical protein [Oscillospiraceae bacterium]